MSLYDGKEYTVYYLTLCNSIVAEYILNILAPTINFQAGDIGRIPLIENKNVSYVSNLGIDCINLSKQDWDSFETSWDFKVHPLVKNHANTIREAYSLWDKECNDRFRLN